MSSSVLITTLDGSQTATYDDAMAAGHRYLEEVRTAPAFSDDDHAFARELQQGLGIEPLGYPTDVTPLADDVEPTSGGSTDVAEVTRLAPGVSFYIATAGLNLPWHSWATSASHGRPSAAAGASVAAKVMAMTAMDFLQDEDLRRRAKAAFDEAMQANPYVSPVPKGQKPPLPED